MDQAEQRLWISWRERGDRGAFEALVRPHLAFAVDFARRIGAAGADADDLVQQALVALAGSTDGRPAKVGLRAWLGRTISLGARTLRRTTRRRARREQRVTHAVDEAAAARSTDPVEDRDEVDAALDQLQPDERQAVVLRFLHDLEYREVAHVMGSTPGACRLKVHRALGKIRARLGKNATALLATGTLLLGAMPASALTQSALQTATATAASAGTSLTAAHTFTGGMLIMAKVLKAATVVAVLLLLSWWWVPTNETTQPRTNREAGAAGATGNDKTLVVAEDSTLERTSARGETTPDKGGTEPAAGDTGAETAPAEDLDVEWASYDQTRAMGRMGKRMRGISARLHAMRPAGMAADPKPPGKADVTTRLHLEELVAKYRKLAAGSERSRVLRSFISTHRTYITRTRDPEFLPFVESVANDGTETEQPRAIASLYGVSLQPAVDLLRRALANSNPNVRARAVDALAEIKGTLAEEAHEALITALRDEAASVRWTTAMALEFRVGQEEDVEALLPRLPFETHPIAMHAMVRAVLALDPDEGRLRLDAVMEDAPAAARTLYREALERREIDDPMKALQNLARAKRVRPAKTSEIPPADRRDPAKREYLDRLAEEALNMPSGPDRLEHIKSLAREHREYLRDTGDTGLLPMLDKIVHNSPSTDERRAVIHSLWNGNNPVVVKLLISWSRDPAADIRAPSLGALSAVSGKLKPLARAALVARLQDEVTAVRRNAALFLGSETDHPELVEPLLNALSTETDFAAAYAMVRAIKKIDRKTGRSRIDRVLPKPNANVQMAIDRNYG